MPTSFIVGKLVEVAHGQTIAKKDGGSYEGTRITYRSENNELKEQVLHNNVLKYNPAVTEGLESLTSGDVFTIRKEKENDFWNVKEITKGDNRTEASKSERSAASSPRSTFETPEERAKRQLLIVRQSSMASAINYSAQLDKPLSEKKIFATAEAISRWVFAINPEVDEEID